MTAPAQGASGSGRSYPIGVTVTPGGANFSVYSRSASGLDLMLFDRENDAQPARTIPIDPDANRTNHYWHVFVDALNRDSFMATARTARSTRPVECGSIPPKCSSIPMGAALSSPRLIPVMPRVRKGTIAPRR